MRINWTHISFLSFNVWLTGMSLDNLTSTRGLEKHVDRGLKDKHHSLLIQQHELSWRVSLWFKGTCSILGRTMTQLQRTHTHTRTRIGNQAIKQSDKCQHLLKPVKPFCSVVDRYRSDKSKQVQSDELTGGCNGWKLRHRLTCGCRLTDRPAGRVFSPYIHLLSEGKHSLAYSINAGPSEEDRRPLLWANKPASDTKETTFVKVWALCHLTIEVTPLSISFTCGNNTSILAELTKAMFAVSKYNSALKDRSTWHRQGSSRLTWAYNNSLLSEGCMRCGVLSLTHTQIFSFLQSTDTLKHTHTHACTHAQTHSLSLSKTPVYTHAHP